VLPDCEAFHRDELERARSSQAFMEEQVHWFEKFVADSPGIISPAHASHLRQRIQVWRQEVEKEKRWVQELERWEQERKLNPGLKPTATHSPGWRSCSGSCVPATPPSTNAA
jgi:Cys-tRNA synthase (O-phospho-L-seryl-tRNA:Cys-tRNA synthase)